MSNFEKYLADKNLSITPMKIFKDKVLYLAWAVALAATLGSLYFSEVLHLPPCILCWYQRIFMYPLAIILAVGILQRDKNVHRYALPLTIGGLIIAVYQNLLYYNIIPESLAPCTLGVSCTTKQLELFGVIGIPALSLIAFAVIALAMLLHRKVKDL